MKATIIPHFSSLTDAEYFKTPLLSNSGLNQFKHSLLDTPGGGMKAKPETLQIGTLLHLATYQPGDFVQAYKDCTISSKAANMIVRMSVAAKAGSPVLMSFLKNKHTRYETPIAARVHSKDLEAFVQVKPDAAIWNRAGTKITYGHDLKSTACTSLAAFLETFDTYGYWRQGFLYRFVTGAKNWFFTGVTKAEPHRVFIVDINQYPEKIAEAKAEFLGLIETYLELNPRHAARCRKYLDSLL